LFPKFTPAAPTNHAFGSPSLKTKSFMSGRVSNLEDSRLVHPTLGEGISYFLGIHPPWSVCPLLLIAKAEQEQPPARFHYRYQPLDVAPSVAIAEEAEQVVSITFSKTSSSSFTARVLPTLLPSLPIRYNTRA
jgi:hypothetical protein